MERKLAAILAADVVGYTGLMGADEAGTLARLKAHRKELIDPKVAEHHGRVVKLMGDGALVEFASVVDAVECAVDIQRGMAERNADIPEDRRMEFRVGVNLGDVMLDGDDIYGDGVNLAARLQELAEPGGVCVSQDVYRQIRHKMELGVEDMGEQEVKNVAEPLRTYRLRLDSETRQAPRIPAMAAPGLEVPDKPSIAVLPFANMSGDAEQEFFVDGITEDIITEISRFRDLFVIARNSTFMYKGRAVKVQDVAKELGVGYVVEGSVRKAGNRVRVTVQLIDGKTGKHIWAERYDRDLEDIFALQDEVTRTIVAILPGRVEAANLERVERKPPENMPAYEYVLTGKVLHHRSTKKDNAEALRMLERAIELDPKYGHAHAWKACVLGQAWVRGFSDNRDELWDRVVESLQTAYALDENDCDVHRILAAVQLEKKEFDKAEYHQERALSLNPNYDLVVVQQGELLTWLGRPEEGIEWIEKAMRLNPYHPERFWNHRGRALYLARRYEDAVKAFKRITAPNHTHHAFLAAALAQMGEDGEAKIHAGKVLDLEPGFTVESYLDTLPYKHAADREHHREGLIKAGLRE